MNDEATMFAHGVTVYVTTGRDGVPVVFLDTDPDLVGETDEGPAVRVRMNDERIFGPALAEAEA